jgi:hypothetical protein
MFYNASVQGTANFVRTMGAFRPPVEGKSKIGWNRLNTAQKLAVGMTGGSFALAALMREISDEDDDGVKYWDKIPSYVKERNTVILTGWMTGDPKDYVSIPLPYGYNIFPVMGTQLEALINGNKPAGEAAVDFTLAVLGSFNPIGFEDSEDSVNVLIKNATPTIFRSVSQLATNENFAGRMIYKENIPFGTPMPDSSLSFRSTPGAYKSIAEFLNRISGGNEYESGNIDVNPDTIQHVVNFYGGGAWGFIEKSADFGVKTVSGDISEIEPYRIPFASRVMGEADDEYRDQGQFYERRDELGQRVNLIESKRGKERMAMARGNRDTTRLFNRATDLAKRLSDMRKRVDQVKESDRYTEEQQSTMIKKTEARMKLLVDEWNRDYNEAFN